MGTPDMLGTYGTYQYFAEDGPADGLDEGGGKRSKLTFDGETAQGADRRARRTVCSRRPRRSTIEFLVHRDRDANAAVLEIQGQKIVAEGRAVEPVDEARFRAVHAVVRARSACWRHLPVLPPGSRAELPAVRHAGQHRSLRPGRADSPSRRRSSRTCRTNSGLFYTTGFQEDHKARSNGVFADDEFLQQASMVLEERLALFEYAVENYDDGLLFFYFSSSDLQSHMFWWDSDEKHPTRSPPEAKKYFGHIQRLYQRLDEVIGDIIDRYGSQATIIVMSDHGFANFGRQFNLNSWLRDSATSNPPECTSIMNDVDWSRTTAYGLGINGLYLNLKGRERDGIVEPGEQQETLLTELTARLEAVRDVDGKR